MEMKNPPKSTSEKWGELAAELKLMGYCAICAAMVLAIGGMFCLYLAGSSS